MQTRTIAKEVTFTRPFRLTGFDSVEPAGTYRLDLEEEQLDILLFSGWRQIAATLQLRHGGATDYVAIDMQELRDALLRDSAQTTDLPAAPAPALTQQSRMRNLLQLRARRS